MAVREITIVIFPYLHILKSIGIETHISKNHFFYLTHNKELKRQSLDNFFLFSIKRVIYNLRNWPT